MARRPKSDAVVPGGAPFLRGVRLLPERVTSPSTFPFSIPALRDLALDLSTAVTFLVGENGSGKSTLLEGLAVVCGLPSSGGSRNETSAKFGVADDHTLASALRPSFAQRPRDSFFFRAETLAHFATLLDERRKDPFFGESAYARYGGKSLHGRSHGEAFLATFGGRLGQGLWFLDEPEAALSPQRQLAFLALVWQRVEAGDTQLVIATHSPILMTFPGARILALDNAGIHETSLAETSHYRLTREILAAPERYWRHLRAQDDGE
jgi:predicted ATPase